MAGFENYRREASELELELQRMGIALGIDWENEAQVRELAREAFAARSLPHGSTTPEARYRIELFGLAALMLKTMEESAREGMHTHGGPVWRAFARALWAEKQAAGR